MYDLKYRQKPIHRSRLDIFSLLLIKSISTQLFAMSESVGLEYFNKPKGPRSGQYAGFTGEGFPLNRGLVGRFISMRRFNHLHYQQILTPESDRTLTVSMPSLKRSRVAHSSPTKTTSPWLLSSLPLFTHHRRKTYCPSNTGSTHLSNSPRIFLGVTHHYDVISSL